MPVASRMSQSTKRKHVTKEVLDEFRLPAINERIVRVVAGRGNNLHEVYDPNPPDEGPYDSKLPEIGNKYLVSMPTKFRKNVWIKRGDYVVVEPIVEGDKVKAEIVQILYKDQIKYIKTEGKWPLQFSGENENASKTVTENVTGEKAPKDDRFGLSEEDSDNDAELFQNTNRPKVDIQESSSETSSSDE